MLIDFNKRFTVLDNYEDYLYAVLLLFDSGLFLGNRYSALG